MTRDPHAVLDEPVLEQATPTQIDGPVVDGPVPASVAAMRSEPIRVISMKDHAVAEPRVEDRVPLHVQLRSMAEVAGHQTPRELGRLAPPRDPSQVRASHRGANVLWVCAGLAIAAAITLAIWLLAGR